MRKRGEGVKEGQIKELGLEGFCDSNTKDRSQTMQGRA